jgi:hypothetical protein
MPENTLNFEDTFSAMNMSEAEFRSIISKAQSIYSPIIGSFGYRLQIQGDWNDSTVNAYATRQGDAWIVRMFGGMARRPEMTSDGFRLVICHELGHHLGGFPTYTGNWASNEGQSDYFGVHACMRKVIGSDRTPLGYTEPKVVSDCNEYWKNSNNRYICKRQMMAGLSLGNLLASLGGESVSINRKDPRIVSKTSDEHPKAQCRLDTYVAAALCKKQWVDNVIPMTLEDSMSCENRPRCWFAP